jgi:hypothetical protein
VKPPHGGRCFWPSRSVRAASTTSGDCFPTAAPGSIDERLGSMFLTSGVPVLSGGRLCGVQWTGRMDRRFCRRRAAN